MYKQPENQAYEVPLCERLDVVPLDTRLIIEDKPEALRLADELEMWTKGKPAAEELRRLHHANQELVEALETIAEYWSKKNSPDDYEHSQQEYETACLHSAKTAATVLAKYKEQA